MKRTSTLSTREIITKGEELFHKLRWAHGIVICPYCGSVHIKQYDGYTYKCNSCKSRFNDKTRTVMHHSKLSVGVWMQVAYEMMLTNNISSIELANKLQINQKSAWLMQAKLRYVMDMANVKLTGEIAQDEMYIGGCLTNFHYGRKIKLLREKGLMGKEDKRFTKSAIYALNSRLKQPVFGLNDGKNIVLYATPNPIKSSYIHKIYEKHVVGDSVTISDESKLYDNWEEITGAKLYTNNHHNNQYTTDNGLTSNRIENTFSWYKRGFGGRITHCKYHQLYLNEYCFRKNTRHMTTEERFEALVGMMVGNVVRYKDIQNYNPFQWLEPKKTKHRHITTMEDVNTIFATLGCCCRGVKVGKTTYTKKDIK